MSSVGANKLLLAIFGVLALLILGDDVSTYLCLTTPSENYNTTEANPLSAWMFGLMGIIPALTLQGVVKGGGMVVLYKMGTLWNPRTYKLIAWGMGGAVLVTLLANLNNWYTLYIITR